MAKKTKTITLKLNKKTIGKKSNLENNAETALWIANAFLQAIETAFMKDSPRAAEAKLLHKNLVKQIRKQVKHDKRLVGKLKLQKSDKIEI